MIDGRWTDESQARAVAAADAFTSAMRARRIAGKRVIYPAKWDAQVASIPGSQPDVSAGGVEPGSASPRLTRLALALMAASACLSGALVYLGWHWLRAVWPW